MIFGAAVATVIICPTNKTPAGCHTATAYTNDCETIIASTEVPASPKNLTLDLRRLYRANGLLLHLGKSIEIGEFGVGHVWCQCHEKAYFRIMPKTLL